AQDRLPHYAQASDFDPGNPTSSHFVMRVRRTYPFALMKRDDEYRLEVTGPAVLPASRFSDAHRAGCEYWTETRIREQFGNSQTVTDRIPPMQIHARIRGGVQSRARAHVRAPYSFDVGFLAPWRSRHRTQFSTPIRKPLRVVYAHPYSLHL